MTFSTFLSTLIHACLCLFIAALVFVLTWNLLVAVTLIPAGWILSLFTDQPLEIHISHLSKSSQFLLNGVYWFGIAALLYRLGWINPQRWQR